MGLIACQGGKREGESGALPPLTQSSVPPRACWDCCLSPTLLLNCPHTGSCLHRKVRLHVVQCGAVRQASYPREICTKLQALKKSKASWQPLLRRCPSSSGIFRGQGSELWPTWLGAWESIQLARTPSSFSTTEGQLPKLWLQVPAL